MKYIIVIFLCFSSLEKIKGEYETPNDFIFSEIPQLDEELNILPPEPKNVLTLPADPKSWPLLPNLTPTETQPFKSDPIYDIAVRQNVPEANNQSVPQVPPSQNQPPALGIPAGVPVTQPTMNGQLPSQPMASPLANPQQPTPQMMPPYQTGAPFPFNEYPATAQMPQTFQPGQFNPNLPPNPTMFPGSPANQQQPQWNSPGGQNTLPSTPQLPYGFNQPTPEAQLSYSYILSQLMSMLNDPNSREGLLYLVSSLRNFLSNPNSLRLMQMFNNRLNEMMNNPNLYNQYPTHYGGNPTTVITTTQGGGLFDNMHKKGTTLLGLAKDFKMKALDTMTGDIPPLNTVVKLGNNAVDTGFGAVNGLLSSILNPSSSSTTTITQLPNNNQGINSSLFPTQMYNRGN